MRPVPQILLAAFLLLANACTKSSSDPVPAPAPAKSSAKELTAFSIQKADNPSLSLPEDYTGLITGNNITVELPKGVSISSIIARFTLSDKATALVGSTAQVAGQTPNNYSSPVVYTVKAEDGTTQTYTVTLNQTGILPGTNINNTTSYHQLFQSGTYISYAGIFSGYHSFSHLARVNFDFDGDGDEDLLAANSSNTQGTTSLEFYRNNGGIYTAAPSVLGNPLPGLVHPRKAIVADFNKDGRPDVVVAGHGWDQPPFPGEKALLLMNNGGTSFQASFLNIPDGFYHSVTAGDVDNDGDADLFFSNRTCRLLLNNGQGVFTLDNSILPQLPNQIYTSEFYDINNDSYLDLLIAGHEFEGGATTIYWGNSTGRYNNELKSILPVVASRGVVIDIDFHDVDADGKTDILLNRTTHNPIYVGYYLQLIKNQGNTFSDITSTHITANATSSGGWVSWFRFYDYDGDGKKDIISEDKKLGLKWRNVNGVFTFQ